MTVLCSEMESIVGRLLLAERDDGSVLRLEFTKAHHGRNEHERRVRERDAEADEAVRWVERTRGPLRRQLAEYFDGSRREFDLELQPVGTPFQHEVWEALCTIPYGVTWSYAELARSIGRPTAFRAVAAANGQNPISIVVPCHRVIGADGSLTGYGGGLDRKRTLLTLEAEVVGPGGLFAPA